MILRSSLSRAQALSTERWCLVHDSTRCKVESKGTNNTAAIATLAKHEKQNKYRTVETKWFCSPSHCILMPAKIQRFQKPYVILCLCPSHGNNVTHLSFLISHTTTSNVHSFCLILKWHHDFPRHPLYINNSRRVSVCGGRRWVVGKREGGKRVGSL